MKTAKEKREDVFDSFQSNAESASSASSSQKRKRKHKEKSANTDVEPNDKKKKQDSQETEGTIIQDVHPQYSDASEGLQEESDSKRKIKKKKKAIGALNEKDTLLQKEETHAQAEVHKLKKKNKSKGETTENRNIIEQELIASDDTKSTITGSPDEETKKKKTKSKKKKKQLAQQISESNDDDKAPAEKIAQSQSLLYLKTWKEQRDAWSFQKVRQVWLLKHMYKEDEVRINSFYVAAIEFS